MQLVEHAGLGPLVQTSPAGPARAVAELGGSLTQPMPVDRTKAMPSSTSRSDVRGRPVRPCTAGFCGGMSGSTSAQSSSLISRGGGEDAGDDMAGSLRRCLIVDQSLTTYF